MTEEGFDNEWSGASYYNKLTFSAANRMLAVGQAQTLLFKHLMNIPTKYYASKLLKDFKDTYKTAKPICGIPKLMVSLFVANTKYTTVTFVGGVILGSIRIAQPVILIYLLRALQDESASSNEAYMWAGIMSLSGVCQAFTHHTLGYYCYICGWNWKTATTALIYNKLFSLKGNVLQNSNTSAGMLVNMISNDVARLEELSAWGIFFFVSLLEVVAILVILIYILGDVPAAFAGVGCTFLLIPVMMYIAKLFALYRSRTAVASDARVRCISEVIDGISTVKSYAWEIPFFYLIRRLRQTEIDNIEQSQLLKAVNQGLTFSSTTVSAFVTFAVFWGRGRTLTIPVIFATLSLLQVLKQTIGRNWTRSIETGSEAIASSHRIEQFLSLVSDDESSSCGNNSSSSNDQDHKHCTDENKSAMAVVAQRDDRMKGTINKHEYEAVSIVSEGDVELSVVTSGKTDTTDSSTESNSGSGEVLLEIRKSSYFYGSGGSNDQSSAGINSTAIAPVLSDIAFSVSRNELLLVVGPVGCGKSSLLAVVLDEMNLVRSGADDTTIKRVIEPRTTMAYCAQKPWILAASVKKNITIAGTTPEHSGDTADASDPADPMYTLAVESALLVDDFLQFSAYDETEVGERGVSVSGGQKARIALARAVYSDADLYVLDDPLSAVDAQVGKGLFTQCIQGALRNRNKGVVLVTHQLQYLPFADKILVLGKDGRQVFYGTHSEIMSDSSIVSMLQLSGGNDAETSGDGLAAATSEKEESSSADQPVPAPITRQFSRYDPLFRSKSLKRQMTLTANKAQQEQEQSADEKRKQIVGTEEQGVGRMSLEVYIQYIRSGGVMKGVFCISVILFSQVLSMIADYWLRWWASEEYWNQRNNNYVIIYCALAVCCVLAGFFRARQWFQFTLVASSNLHEKCIWAVTHSPLAFFISNPSGRILNRFSKDQNQADELLPVTLFSFIETSVYCMSSMLLVFIAIPWLLLMIPVLAVGLYYVRTKYVCSSREIKRMEAVTRSPIYADFSATLDGLVTLRAYRLEHKISQQFYSLLNHNGNPWFSYLICTRWIGLRLDLGSALLVIVVCFCAVILRSSIDVGLLGFTLVYTMALTGLFQNTVRLSADVETQMTAIERMHNYGELPPESGYSSVMPSIDSELSCGAACINTSASNPNTAQLSLVAKLNEHNKGHVQIRGMTAKYREDLDPVLSKITVDIPAGSKVGICGRTGSGKSSTLIALLRLNIITEGDIVLDGASLLSMDLETARSLISIIPQEPHLFSGTVRFNLDPFSIYSDEQIWAALRDAHIFEYVSKDPLGLRGAVDEGGKNFSVGQRQLLSLARAILRKCKVVLMDEVTASIDFITDHLIQETIRTSPVLKDATIITVAHRLRTIADSDLIVMIQAGNIIETGRSVDLLTKSDSHFRQLAMESNEFDEIFRIASTNSLYPCI